MSTSTASTHSTSLRDGTLMTQEGPGKWSWAMSVPLSNLSTVYNLWLHLPKRGYDCIYWSGRIVLANELLTSWIYCTSNSILIFGAIHRWPVGVDDAWRQSETDIPTLHPRRRSLDIITRKRSHLVRCRSFSPVRLLPGGKSGVLEWALEERGKSYNAIGLCAYAVGSVLTDLISFSVFNSLGFRIF